MIAVLFEADVTPAKQARYLALAAELKPLLATLDGFISIERFQSLTTPGKILSLSWWRDEEAVRAWKKQSLPSGGPGGGQGDYFCLLPDSHCAGHSRLGFRNAGGARRCMIFMSFCQIVLASCRD